MGKKAVIQGKDIGQGLVNQINKFNAKSLTDLSEKLNAWYEKEVAKENAKKFPSDVRLQSLADRKDCLDFFIEEATSVDQLIAKVYSIFTDTDQSGILLSSIHKAKGLEAERVFLVDPPTVPFPHPMAKSPEARTQEYNLRYVAVTRAKSHLVYVA
jgi:superfamily I DNA/RNA helicase